MGLGVGGGGGFGGSICSVVVCIHVFTLHDNDMEMHSYACVGHSTHALVRECVYMYTWERPLGVGCDHDRDSDRDHVHRGCGFDLFNGRLCAWACAVIVYQPICCLPNACTLATFSVVHVHFVALVYTCTHT